MTVRSYISWTEFGASATIPISPCEPYRHWSMSPCADIVGWPVDGPPRWTFTTTSGVSVITAKPRFSIIREKPGPEVEVMAFFPVQAAPITAAIEAISSSIWTKTPPAFGIRAAIRSATSVEGVIG